MSRQEPILHHYVPQFQLRYLVDNDGLLWAYDRIEDKMFKAGTKRVGGAKKFYTYTDKEGNERNEVEKLNSQIEDIAAPIIKKLHLKKKDSLTPQEKADLSVLLALNWMRTPSAKERTEVLLEAGTTMQLRLQAQNKEVFYKQVQEMEEKTGKKFGDREKLRQEILGNRYRVRFNNLAYVQFLLVNLLDLAKSIQGMQWIIVSLNKKRSFILSDVNFVIEQVEAPPTPHGEGGLLTPGSQSMCILTHKLAIVMLPHPGSTRYFRPGLEFVRACNKINAMRSQRFVFANSESLLRKVVEISKIDEIPPEKQGVEVISGPEGKILRFDALHGLVEEEDI